ncbi:hypothetical protein Tco_0656773 [Tanacetum coccineum]|uniref:Uncharacterized protein n=1 Tax=Tanacetum coccineum TaxID=301880 RepID=A0ABQ4X9N9_9ASTR
MAKQLHDDASRFNLADDLNGVQGYKFIMQTKIKITKAKDKDQRLRAKSDDIHRMLRFKYYCLMEARILEAEPLNKTRRSNKPKRSRKRSWEKWSTLREPSGKWDYYVRHDALINTTLIEEIAATGWGDCWIPSE